MCRIPLRFFFLLPSSSGSRSFAPMPNRAGRACARYCFSRLFSLRLPDCNIAARSADIGDTFIVVRRREILNVLLEGIYL